MAPIDIRPSPCSTKVRRGTACKISPPCVAPFLSLSCEHAGDGNKTKMLRPRPRPIKRQQDYITEKTLLLHHACLLSKTTLCKKRQKVIWWPVTFGTVSALIARKIQVLITFQHYHVTQRLVGHNSVESKTKSIRPTWPRPRPRPVWDRSCHKTAVSDPNTGTRKGYSLF